ncbi:MAG: alpha/beta fold hydrolase [Bacteroidia bacterium]|nr:alpha/beta fold hydrolase [Bacteroidia bacterium]
MNSYNKDLFPFESKWISIQGNKLHYIDEGEGDVIIFSHPPVASSFMYRDFIKDLSRKYRCIALDYPSFGLSLSSSNYEPSIEGQASILEEFILNLGLREIYVLGHDTGGPSAFGVAMNHPHLFKGIILTDTIIYPVSEYKELDWMLGIVGGKVFSWFNASTNFLINGTYRYGVRTRKLSKGEREEYKLLFNTRKKRRLVTKMLYNLKESENYMQEVKNGFETTLNDKNALLIYGEKDPVQELGIADRIHKLLPNSELFLIKDEGHFPHEGQPKKMSKIIHNWIENHTVVN